MFFSSGFLSSFHTVRDQPAAEPHDRFASPAPETLFA